MSAKPRQRYLWITRIFGSLGYMFCLLLWLWMTLQFLYPMIEDKNSPWLMLDPACQKQSVSDSSAGLSLPQPLAGGLLAIVTVTMIGLCIYLVLTLPRQVAKTGTTVIKKTTNVITPLATRHKATSKKQRLMLNARIAACIKLAVCTLPVLVLYIWPGQAPLPTIIVHIVALWCGGLAALSFLLQYALARWLRIPDDLLW